MEFKILKMLLAKKKPLTDAPMFPEYSKEFEAEEYKEC
jgi:hypothetical protein